LKIHITNIDAEALVDLPITRACTSSDKLKIRVKEHSKIHALNIDVEGFVDLILGSGLNSEALRKEKAPEGAEELSRVDLIY
jgi:hypothetical protein